MTAPASISPMICTPLRGHFRKLDVAAALRRGIAKERRQQQGALEIKTDVMLVGEADRAVELDAGLRDGKRVLRCLGFHRNGKRGLDTIGIVGGRDLIEQRPQGFGFYVDVDRFVLQRLKGTDWFAELLADAQIFEG